MLLRTALLAFAIVGSNSAVAGQLTLLPLTQPPAIIPVAQLCQCTGGFTHPGGVTCTSEHCVEAPRSAPFRKVRGLSDCADYIGLRCNKKSCELVCTLPAKKKS